nr:hypothetical protein [uncultured Flavobacterium sp.]
MNHLYWRIPSSIDLESLLDKYPPKFKRPYKIDYFYYFIELLCDMMEYNDLDGNGGYVNLNAQLMQSIVHNYNEYLDYLLEHRVIRTDKKYIPGAKSMGYVLNKLNYDAEIKQIAVKSSVVRKNRAKKNRALGQEMKATCTKHSYLTKWFNEKLQIDAEGAYAKIEELFPELTGAIRGVRKGRASRATKKYSAKLAVQKFAAGNFYYKLDENVGRFHSNLTNIKKELRNFITYDGKPLVNIDIKNSQPLLSTILLEPSFYALQKKPRYINIHQLPSSFNLLTNNNKHTYTDTIIMLVKVLQSSDIKEVNIYSSIAKSGDFYQQLSKIMYPKRPFEKAEMKKLTYTVFFSNNRSIQGMHYASKRDFRRIFPDIYKIFSVIKRKNHRALSHILQRIESEIMIQKACKRISIEQPTLPIFTIHDSILTTDGNQDYVEKVIIEEAFKLTGLKVSLGKEILNQK